MNALLALSLCLAAAGAEDRPCVVIVVGASGAPEYAAQFRQSADRWQAAAKKAGAEVDPDRTVGASRRHRS